MREGSMRRLLVLIMPLAAVGLVVAVIVLPRIAPGPRRAASPVTETRPLDRRHRLDVGYTNEYLYDSTYETCEALGIKQLAHKLRVPTSPLSGIARAYADQNYSTAVRSGPYHGCLDALISQRTEARRRG